MQRSRIESPDLPGELGTRPLEVLDEATTRIVGSTSNPIWYAEQLAVLPAPFRIVQCPELHHAVRVIGLRMLVATNER